MHWLVTIMELISIITPAARARHCLPRAVRSVLAQGYTHWEMIIVSDDGEDYAALLADQGIADERFRHVVSEHRFSGPNAARNVGLAQARGEFIAPLDADDGYAPERLGQLLTLARRHRLACDGVRVIDDDTEQELYRIFADKPATFFLRCDEFISLSTPLLFLMERSLIKRNWNPEVLLGEDTLFNLRLLEQAGGAACISAPLHEYRVGGGSICHASDACAKAEQAYSFCLDALKNQGLGFETRYFRAKARDMLLKKRVLNRRYASARAAGFQGSFQHYFAQCVMPGTGASHYA